MERDRSTLAGVDNSDPERFEADLQALADYRKVAGAGELDPVLMPAHVPELVGPDDDRD